MLSWGKAPPEGPAGRPGRGHGGKRDLENREGVSKRSAQARGIRRGRRLPRRGMSEAKPWQSPARRARAGDGLPPGE